MVRNSWLWNGTDQRSKKWKSKTNTCLLDTPHAADEPPCAYLGGCPHLQKKLIDDYTSDELSIDVSPRIKLLKVTEPPKREKGIMVANVAELVHKLKHEAKAI